MARKLLYKNKKALSGIITAVIMVALVMAAAVIVWGVVNSTIQEEIEGTEACFGNYDKVTIDRLYTCYDSVNDRFQFSLSIADIEADSVIISVSSEGSTNSYTITNTEQTISGLANYGSTGFGTDLIVLPSENAGKTYIANGFASSPDVIKIAPVINGQQCDISDSLSDIEECP